MTTAAPTPDLPVAEILRRRLVRAVFQPVMTLADGSVAGYEALSRVGPGSGGLPLAWLEAAEEQGLRTELEPPRFEIIAEAGSPPGDGLLFVNSSVKTVTDDRLLDLRRRLPEHLVIDLTEREALREDGDLISRLAPLTGSGVQLAIDDGGTGSFLELARVAPSFVKLDRRIVHGIEHDPTRQSLVAAVVRFGHEVGFSVVAECVERLEELEALRRRRRRLGPGLPVRAAGRAVAAARSRPHRHTVVGHDRARVASSPPRGDVTG